MKALSIRQPWAWLIVHGYKDVENRTWRTGFRGRFGVHASKTFDREGYRWVQQEFPKIKMPAPEEFGYGAIVGVVDLIDCVTLSGSPWFFGPYGFVLANPLPCSPMRFPGKLYFFDGPCGLGS